MYELNPVGEHTFYMDCPANVGVYVYGDNKCCLIDSGSDKSAAKKVLGLIEERGFTLEKVFCTHSHADHIGGCAALRERTGCDIYAPGVCAQLVRYPFLTPVTLFGGKPLPEMRNKFIQAKPCECNELSESVLPEGLEMTRLDGHDFEQVGFKTRDGVWFLADAAVGEDIIAKYRIAFLHDAEKHLQSLEKLKTLDGRLFIPAHCAPLSDIKPLAEKNIANVFEVAEIIKEICQDGITADGLVEKLFERFGIKLYLMQYELISHSARGYLAWLYDRHEIECVFDGSRLLWKTTQ